jgi:predicted nucleic acid-binding protein
MDNRILLDASAIISAILDEPEGNIVSELTCDKVIASPNIIQMEFANALTRMMRKRTIERSEMLKAMESFELLPLQFIEVNYKNVIEIAWKYKIYAYDACYLDVAERLKLPLITFDGGMKNVGNEMGITMLGGGYADV